MFDIGLQEMLVIGVIALLVFGPSKLPELGRMVGRALRESRRARHDFRTTAETPLHHNETAPIPQPASPAPETTAAVTPLPSELEQTFADPEGSAAAPAETAVEVGEPYCAQRGSRL